jgi:hypothetical protein
MEPDIGHISDILKEGAVGLRFLESGMGEDYEYTVQSGDPYMPNGFSAMSQNRQNQKFWLWLVFGV